MNLTALITATRNRLGVPSADALFTDTVVTELINSALHLIEVEADWGWLETSESITPANGTATYTPNTNWLRTISLQWGDYPPMERVDIEQLISIGSPAGRPQFYAVYAEALNVRPVPTGTTPTMTHRYIKKESDLSGTDTPLMPASYHFALVDLAAYLGFRRIGNLAEAGGALAAYEAWRDKMLGHGSRYSEDQGGGLAPAKPAAEKP